MGGFFNRSVFGLCALLAASALGVASAPGADPRVMRTSPKLERAARRARYAEADSEPRYRRSRNPRHRRPLRANRLHVSRRTRRSHRRARCR